MKISFDNVSKRFAYEWIFRDVNLVIPEGQKLAIKGPNGSGKSTFLKVLMGTIEPSLGQLNFSINNKPLPVTQVYNRFSMTAPYMDLPDNFTMKEILKFHLNFRESVDRKSIVEIIDLAQLSKSKRKLLRQFSSGMKQRFKLALAILTDSDVLILDEPTTNLDDEGKLWFHNLVAEYLRDRTLIIASNEKFDLELCDHSLDLLAFKKSKKKRNVENT